MIHIREAVPSDNDGLLQLTSLTPMDGKISIRIDRNPDFFSLLSKRGQNKVFVAEKDNKIIGSVSAASVRAVVNGNPNSVTYVGDLKVHPQFQGSHLAYRMIKHLHDFLISADADLIFCTAAYGNNRVLPFFEGKLGFPRFFNIGIFRVFQIIPSPFQSKSRKYYFEFEGENQNLYERYNEHFKKYRLGPIFQKGSLSGARHITVRSLNKIRASLSLVDISESKQNVLISMHFFLNITVRIMRLIHRIIPIANLPKINDPIRMLYIKAFAFQDGYEDAFHFLIQKARNMAYEEKYSFLVIGVHEKDPLGKILKKYPKFTFKSLGMITSLKKRNDEIQKLLQGIPFEDYSLV